MNEYTVYSPSGAIRCILVDASGPLNDIRSGEWFVEGAYDALFYRVDVAAFPHAVVLKTTISYSISQSTIDADGFDEAIISGIPAGAFAFFGGELQLIPDGTIQFSADLPGDYDIVLQHPLYLDTTVTITAQ